MIFQGNPLRPLSGNNLKIILKPMICIKTEIPQEICDIDDELKAIYHSKDTVCIWAFKTRIDRNKFMDETAGMLKNDRELHFESFYKAKS
jgi:hypothetical protein